MIIINLLVKIITQIFFVIILFVFSTNQLLALEKFKKGNSIASYFSGILLLNDGRYEESHKYLQKLDGLENSHLAFSSKYLYSLVNSNNLSKAFYYSKKLEREKKDNFESDLIIGVYYLKNLKFELSNKYFLKAKNRQPRSLLDSYVVNTLYLWSNLHKINFEKAVLNFQSLDKRFENLNKIQNVFLHCFFNKNDAENVFNKLVSDDKTDFSRYNYFFAKYLNDIGNISKANKIVNNSLKKHPRNLLLNQYKIDLERSKNNFDFNCRKKQHVAAEILYITANVLSTESIYPLSNFYLNLSKFLNDDFKAFDTLMAENFYNINDLPNSIKIYKRLTNHGNAFKWYSNKQISRILIKEGKKKESIKLLSRAYNELPSKGVYETFDYAEFLKNNEEFEKSIKFYTSVLTKINKQHPLYPEVTDGRGVAYERIGEWKKAEKDLLDSLKISPNQAYVINYLAYSWIEQGVKIQKSLEMLKKANELKSNDPYIIDSLGWALFKLNRFEESKTYLQLAVKLMPADPIVNDHYGDVLWKNGKKIQARYYWNYVLNLEKAEQSLKEKIEQKLIKGL